MILALIAASIGLAAGGSPVIVTPDRQSKTPMRRSVIGVNHLAYGGDGTGYGMILKGSHNLDPALVALQKDIGFGSLRYPGGCGGTHGFEWKKNAGLEGGYTVMGVVEFMGMCEQVGADPIMGISSHRGTPEEAAEYVEFLNKPARSGFAWADRRAERGHPKPYGVRYFEYGNETYHGTHPRPGEPKRRIDPKDYAASYLKFQAAMKAVDSDVLLGVPFNGGKAWDDVILERIADKVDFFVVHTYASVPVRTNPNDYLRIFLDRREGIRTTLDNLALRIGRKDVKFAITEFNAVQSDYRTLSAALVNVESLMAFARDPRIVHADYWQFVNEGFGMVRGKTGAFVMRPSAYAFKLYSKYTLDRVMGARVEDGRVAVGSAGEKDSDVQNLLGKNLAEGISFGYISKGNAGTGTEYVRHGDGVHELRFNDDRAMNFYHLQTRIGNIPVGYKCDWKVSATMWTEGMNGSGANLEVVDGRGWDSTKSAVLLPAVRGIDPVLVSAVYRPREDNPGSIIVRFRRDGGAGAGSVFVKDLKVEALEKVPPRESAVSVQYSSSRDHAQEACLLINRSFEAREVIVRPNELLRKGGNSLQVFAETLTGPSPYATNEEDPFAVKISDLEVCCADGEIRMTLPPHSLSGVKYRVTGMQGTLVIESATPGVK